MADYPTPPPAVSFPPLPLPAADVQPISEHHFLYGDRPHPAAVEHMQSAIDRVKPPSLVKLDRGEALIAGVVAWRALELGGQYDTPQTRDALAYVRDLADRYTEAAP